MCDFDGVPGKGMMSSNISRSLSCSNAERPGSSSGTVSFVKSVFRVESAVVFYCVSFGSASCVTHVTNTDVIMVGESVAQIKSTRCYLVSK